MALTISEVSATSTAPGVSDRRDIGVSVPQGSAATPPVATKPATAEPVKAAAQTSDPNALADAVKALNDRFASQNTDLKFSVDKTSGQTVVRIVDSKDGKVLRQIPTEDALRIARTLSGNPGSLLEDVA